VVVTDWEVDGPSTLELEVVLTLTWTDTSLTFDVTATGSWSGIPLNKQNHYNLLQYMINNMINLLGGGK